MYVQRLVVKNYRSIQELDIRFTPGKNVIVGRNNAGKSNIIKALDVVLGEYSPTYSKNEVIQSDDFCRTRVDGQEVSAGEILIYCELRRLPDEPLNYEEICACNGTWLNKSRVKINDILEDYEDLFVPENEVSKNERVWLDTKNEDTCRDYFEDKFIFAFGISARMDESGHIEREGRFLFRENPTEDWILSYRTNIRTELLQSAIVPPFRDPQSQLKLTKWSWYGKLIKSLINEQKSADDLQEAVNSLKVASDTVFEDIKESISSGTLRVAFPQTELHFQLGEDVGPEIFKNCVLYVDDGFKGVSKNSNLERSSNFGCVRDSDLDSRR